MKAKFNLEKYKEASQSLTKPNDINQNMEENKSRREELIRGQKNLLKGIFSNVNTSYYHDAFK